MGEGYSEHDLFFKVLKPEELHLVFNSLTIHLQSPFDEIMAFYLLDNLMFTLDCYYLRVKEGNLKSCYPPYLPWQGSLLQPRLSPSSILRYSDAQFNLITAHWMQRHQLCTVDAHEKPTFILPSSLCSIKASENISFQHLLLPIPVTF